MRKTSFIHLIFILFLFSCGNQVAQEDTGSTLAATQSELDTILEKNNPIVLDLNKHQLFIDTTRTSAFYSRISNWEINPFRKENIERQLQRYFSAGKTRQKNQTAFPKQFIKLRKNKGEYVLYDRSDGTDPRYEIRDSVLIYYGVHEPTIAIINGLLLKEEGRVDMNIILPISDDGSEASTGTFTIEQTTEPGIYKIKLDSEMMGFEDYVVSKDDIYNYDLVVNHSPKRKVLEYDGFEKIGLAVEERSHKVKLGQNNEHLLPKGD